MHSRSPYASKPPPNPKARSAAAQQKQQRDFTAEGAPPPGRVANEAPDTGDTSPSVPPSTAATTVQPATAPGCCGPKPNAR
jgi:hypothetical protein